MDERTPGYYAVIPASVRYDDSIPANAKLLYGEISALISSEGFCYAANSYFSELYKVSERTISSLISKLKDAGHITLQIERDETGLIKRRKLFLTVSTIDGQPHENIFYTPGKDFREGIEENFQYTNTSITDICKENKKESPPEKAGKRERAPRTDFDPLPLFVAWVGDTFGDLAADCKNEIYFALVRFSENRTAIKKPMKSKASVTALFNRLLKISEGCQDRVSMIIDMLDTATSCGWQSVYPPKGVNAPKPQKSQPGRCYEEL